MHLISEMETFIAHLQRFQEAIQLDDERIVLCRVRA